MIRKPPAGWGRESTAVTAARSAATTGVAAVKTAGRVMRGTYLCGFGAVWLFGSLGSLATGSIAGFIGCGVVGLLLIRFGRRAFRPQQEKAQVEPTIAPPPAPARPRVPAPAPRAAAPPQPPMPVAPRPEPAREPAYANFEADSFLQLPARQVFGRRGV